MQVILQGSLRHFAAEELLSFLGRRAHNGTLDIESGGKRVRLLFEGDHIVWAEGSGATDAADAAVTAFMWSDGSFTVLDSFVLPDNAKRLSLQPMALAEEAKRRIAEAMGFPDATTFRVVDDPALQQQVALAGEEFRLLFRLGAGRTFRELLADFPIPRKELASRLKRLQSLGLVTISGAEAQEPTQEEEPWGEKTAFTPPAPPVAAEPEPQPTQKLALPDLSAMKAAAAAEPAPVHQAPPPPAPPVQPAAPPPPPAPSAEAAAEATVAQAPPKKTVAPKKTTMRKRTMIGSLTPEATPENVYPLLDDEVVIGRAAENAIPIQDGSISSRHARIVRTPEGFIIEDLKSRNGTFVNGEKVEGQRKLADGDLLRLGKILMTFNVARDENPGETTQPEVRVG